ncbi:MAG: DUF502 domain-containing protein [Verrucomicrobiota bacterium]
MSEQVTHFRNTFLAGLLTLVPIAVTLYVANWIFNLLTGRTARLLKRLGYELFDIAPEFAIRLLALVLSVAIIWLVGLVARNVAGKRIILFAEDIFRRLPMLGSVHATVKQIGQALFSSPDTAMFRKVALIEYPKEDSYALGFVTADAYAECNDAVGEDLVSIFLPTTPNPTSGYLLFIPREKVSILKLSVGEAMRLIISAGAVKPPVPSGATILNATEETADSPVDE